MQTHRVSRRGTLGSVGAIIGAALIPKCPFCVAAALSALGLGTTLTTHLAPIVRPAAIVIAAIALVVSAAAMWRARRRRGCGACAATQR